MRFNTKVRYGLRTMIELALINENIGTLQKNIAKNQEISDKYLDHIIASLKVSGLIKNVKGKKSGYKLTKRSEEINVFEIFSAFESNLLGPDCIESDMACQRSEKCAAKVFWSNFNTAMIDFLKSVSLRDLAYQQINIIENKNVEKMFYI